MTKNSEAELSRAAEAFCQRHNLVVGCVNRPDSQVIELIFETIESFSDAVGVSVRDHAIAVEEPAWALIRSMILRATDHAEAGFVSLAAGSVATTEVISRAVLESALNVLYILEQDRVARLYDYLAGYIAQERSELGRWRDMAERMAPAEKLVHQGEMSRKQEAVDGLENIVEQFARDARLAGPARSWPKVADRFRAVGNEVDHRLLYAAMCSQAHNDAEDLFNTFVLGAISNWQPASVARDFENRQKKENLFFARLLLYRSVEYVCKCIKRYGESYTVGPIESIGARGYERMQEIARELCEIEQREREQFRKTKD